jgi:hypothetical protein
MKMGGHDAKRQQPHLVTDDSGAQDAKKGVVIRRVLEDREPAVPTIERVIDQAAFGGAVWSSHERNVNDPVKAVNGKRFRTPFLGQGGSGIDFAI